MRRGEVGGGREGEGVRDFFFLPLHYNHVTAMTMAASVLFISRSCNFPGGHLGDGAPGVNGIYEGTIKIKQRVHVCVRFSLDCVYSSIHSPYLFQPMASQNRKPRVMVFLKT